MKKTLFLLFSFFLLSASQGVFGATDRPEGKVVAQINVEGCKLDSGTSLDAERVKSRLKTKEGGTFSQGIFDQDLKNLALESDHVEPSLRVMNNQVYITIYLWPKQHIRNICWEGNDGIETHKLMEKLDIPLRSSFDRLRFNRAFQNVKQYYVKQGYFEAKLDYTVIPDPDSNCVDIEVCIDEGRMGRIRDICFYGVDDEERCKIEEFLTTKTYFFLTSWVSGAGTYQKEVVDFDVYRITTFLQNEGFADAKVDAKVVECEDGKGIIVEFHCFKGECYQLGKVTFSGNELYTDEQIRSLILACEGGVYSPEEIRQSSRNISQAYGARGYIDVTVNQNPILHESLPQYDVHLDIVEGDCYRVGMVKVFGNCSTQTCVILHESTLIPGDVFDSRKLKATEQKLLNSEYFASVNVYASRGDEAGLGSNFRDVHIEVQEKSTGSASASGTFNTTTKLSAGFDITERNFNWKGLFRLWSEGLGALRGGGEFLHAKVTIGTKQLGYNFSWLKPHFWDTDWTVGFDLGKNTNRYSSHEYVIDSRYIKPRAFYTINAYTKLGVEYRLMDEKWEVKDGAAPSIVAQAKKSQGTLSGIGATLYYDSVDSPYRPTQGIRSDLGFEVVGLGGDFEFLKFFYNNTLYMPCYGKGAFKYRANINLIQPFGDTTAKSIPIGERLFLGGETTVRGYNWGAIGPRFEGTTTPEGGLSSVLFSAEYQYPLVKQIDAFAFVDAGAVSEREYKWGSMKMSYGAGVRLYVLPGAPPIAIGYGIPVNPDFKEDRHSFFFALGARF